MPLLYAFAAMTLTGASYRTQNFTVTAPQTEIAKKVADAAERHRSELARQWLEAELPDWSSPCPISVRTGDRLRARGATSYVFRQGQALDWEMELTGPVEAVLECVLPHEVMHTILATHFGRPLPRWAEEGICTIVEPPAELSRHHVRTLSLVRRRETMPVARLLQLEYYPRDPIPFYMQSFSLSYYLVATGGRQKFVQFLDEGSRSRNWTSALNANYGLKDLAALETAWMGSISAVAQSETVPVRPAAVSYP